MWNLILNFQVFYPPENGFINIYKKINRLSTHRIAIVPPVSNTICATVYQKRARS